MGDYNHNWLARVCIRGFLVFFPLIMISCGANINQSVVTTEQPFYLPPITSATPNQIQTDQSLTETSKETPTTEALITTSPACTNNLLFLEDETIPDGTKVEPGTLLDKRWLVENSGTCNWNSHYRLNLIAGSEMQAVPKQALFPARGSSHAVIRISFTAPDEPGQYQSTWQAFSPDDEPFGDPIFIDIIVE